MNINISIKLHSVASYSPITLKMIADKQLYALTCVIHFVCNLVENYRTTTRNRMQFNT